MNEQPAPPASRGTSTTQRRRREAWRFRRRQAAAQAAAARDARIAELMVRAIEHQVNVRYDPKFLLYIQPDPVKLYTDTTYSERVSNPLMLVNARVAALIFQAVQAQMDHEFGVRDGSARGGRARARGQGQGRARGGAQGARYDRGCRGSGGGGRDRRGSHRALHSVGAGGAGQQNPPGHQAPNQQVPNQQIAGQQVAPEPATGGGLQWWTRPQARLEEMADADAP